MKYWHKYHTLKLLFSLSCSNALILAHIIRIILIMLIVQVLLLQISQVHSNIHVHEM